MKHTNKKGQVMQNIGALGVGIAVLVIILSVTFLVMAQLKTQTIDQGSTIAVTNESFVFTNATATTLSSACMGFSCSALYNDSDNSQTISTGNYTCSISGDTVTQITPTLIGFGNRTTGTFYLDYSCKAPSKAFNATNTLTNATQTIPGWIPLIILVAIGGIILGLVAAFKQQG